MYCKKCGAEIDDDADFCPECGTPVHRKTASQDSTNQRKVVYAGTLYKCPNCGEPLKSFEITCPVCGYELRNIGTTDATKQFSERMADTDDKEETKQLIKTYPIPNTREDINEFLILANTNINYEDDDELRDAWISMFFKCYQKAIILFPDNDSILLKFQNEYNNLKDEYSKKEAKKRRTKLVASTTSSIGNNLSKIITRYVLIIVAIALYFKTIQVDKLGENSTGWEFVADILLIVSACLLNEKSTGIDYLIVIGTGMLEIHYNDLLMNGSAMLLNGMLIITIAIVKFVMSVMSVIKKNKGSHLI